MIAAMDKDQFDDEPVYYCKRCLSLKIREMAIVQKDYCVDCNSADIGVTTIDEWNKMYEKKYGHPFVQKKELKWPYWY
jgi:hypothetical protein